MVLRKSFRVLRRYKPRSVLLESKEIEDETLLFESNTIATLSKSNNSCGGSHLLPLSLLSRRRGGYYPQGVWRGGGCVRLSGRPTACSRNRNLPLSCAHHGLPVRWQGNQTALSHRQPYCGVRKTLVLYHIWVNIYVNITRVASSCGYWSWYSGLHVTFLACWLSN